MSPELGNGYIKEVYKYYLTGKENAKKLVDDMKNSANLEYVKSGDIEVAHKYGEYVEGGGCYNDVSLNFTDHPFALSITSTLGYSDTMKNLFLQTHKLSIEFNQMYYKEKEKPYAIYRTTGDSQEVRLFGYDSDEVIYYIDKVTIEETGEVITGNSYTFANAGDHKVYIELNPDITEIGNVYFNGSIYDGSTIFRIDYFRGVSELISVSENLFSNCTKVTDFSQTFYLCSGLTSIPENLFKYNTAVTSFSQTFSGCKGLTSIPENLFSNNTKVTNFSYTFSSCTGLTGNVPTDTDGTPIYNRSGEGKEGYAVVTQHEGCFYNCTGLTDYDSIPSIWK